MRTANTDQTELMPRLTESSHYTQPHCWLSHAVAHLELNGPRRETPCLQRGGDSDKARLKPDSSAKETS